MGKGGAERVISTLSNFLVQQGDSVSIITLWNKESEYVLDDRIEYIRLNLEKEGKTIKESLFSIKDKIRIIKKHINECQPDVVVAFNTKLAILCKMACPLAKVIGSERSNPKIRQKNPRIALSMKASVILNGFVFQTEGAKECYPKSTQKKSVVISNMIPDGIRSSVTSYKKRGETIIAVGRLEKNKRFDLLINAWKELAETYPDYTINIFGDGEQKEELSRMINNQDLQNTVFLRGKTDRIIDELSKSRIFVLCSDYEGMPNALIEAMACGCACISSNCEFGPSELIDDGNNGLLFPTGSVKDLVNALEKVIQNPELGESLSNNALGIINRLSTKPICLNYREYFIRINERNNREQK